MSQLSLFSVLLQILKSCQGYVKLHFKSTKKKTFDLRNDKALKNKTECVVYFQFFLMSVRPFDLLLYS